MGEATDHFEIYPERYTDDEPTGKFLFRFRYANGEVGPVSMQRYRDRTDANRGIHDFLDAVDPEGKGTDRTHAEIIDTEE